VFEWNPLLIAGRPTLYFVYGLAFFLLGFAILIQRRKSSRLKLAKTLPWLALFALIHGLAEWGYLFIPLNEPYLSPGAVQGLRLIQILLWILSFVFLICFGLALFEQAYKKSLFLWPMGVFGALLVFFLWLADHSIGIWLASDEMEIFARYVLCIPGASLAAFGLNRQRGELRNLGSKRLLRNLEIAVLSFAGYALAGGLVAPEAAFFPANVINVVNFKNLFGFPVELLRAGLGTMMAFSILNVLRMYELEDQKRFAEINRREALAAERERISRDLHDGVIQSVYAVGLTLQRLKKTGTSDPQWTLQLEYVLNSLDTVVTDIRRYIQNLLPENDGKELLGDVDWLEDALSLPVEIKTDSRMLSRLSPAASEHLNLIIREALTNVSKHAQATNASVCFRTRSDGLEVEIKDNGKGLAKADNPGERKERMGLRNIKSRVAALNGTCEIVFTETGTSVQVWIPWEGNIIAEKGEGTGS